MNSIEIIKANGEKAIFQISKLIASLKKAGASKELANDIAASIRDELYSGMTTKEIYKKAFAQLRKHSRPTAARYKLKKAIMELGETGYPFEKFVGALLASEGFKTQVGVIVQGNCVTHEVDVIAKKDNHHYMCECKFHNRQGRNCNVKIPLYIQSRFKDVEQAWLKKSGHEHKLHQGWIFTNTRFSIDAMKYGKCVGLKLVSWDYPENDGIKDRIDKLGVHPITCLTTLSSKEKKHLLNRNIVLCIELCKQPNLLKIIGINESRHNRILNEATELCTKSKIER